MTQDTILNSLPFVEKLDTIFQIKPYLDTPEGMEKYNKMNNAIQLSKKLAKLNSIIKGLPFVLLLILIVATNVSKIIAVFLCAILFSLIMLFYWLYETQYLPKTKDVYNNESSLWTNKIVEKINEKLKANYFVLLNSDILFFNQNFCVYIETNNGTVIGMKKSNIKKVTLEHVKKDVMQTENKVPFGSFKNGVPCQCFRTTLTTDFIYEWWLDLYTGFIEQPHFKLEFPNEKDAEESAKKAYPLLMR